MLSLPLVCSVHRDQSRTLNPPGTGVIDSRKSSRGCWDFNSILSDAMVFPAPPSWIPSPRASTITLLESTSLTTASNSSRSISASLKSLKENVKSTRSFEGRSYSPSKLLCHSFCSSSSEGKKKTSSLQSPVLECPTFHLLPAEFYSSFKGQQRNDLLQEAPLLSSFHNDFCRGSLSITWKPVLSLKTL